MKSNFRPVYSFILLLGILFLDPIIAKGQNGPKYWVQFKDKKYISYSVYRPDEFLSSRAIQRRIKNNIPVIEEDLPVSSSYTDSLRITGARVMYTSKWFNSATIEVKDESIIDRIKDLSFVKTIEKTADAPFYKNAIVSDKNKVETSMFANNAETFYGYGYTQIKLENGIFLHDLNYRGRGIHIAILDVGFYKADIYDSLDSTRIEGRILGTYDFVNPGGDVYNAGSHGAAVLSTIAADKPGTLVGTAPDASFWLLHSEDGSSEYPVEEDNWVAAAEFADSAGADIISTSLGYSEFNNPVFNHTYKDMNGITTRISKAASKASSKGIIVVVSAGNEGDDKWHYIDAPADAINILAVGAVTADSARTGFSSYGPSADGRVKPDIAAMGQDVAIESDKDQYTKSNGTSFSTPIISGLAACLIQAFPTLKASDILRAIKMSGNSFYNPNTSVGYGIPDFKKAYEMLQYKIEHPVNTITVYPNPFRERLIFDISFPLKESIKITCYNTTGNLLFETVKSATDIINLESEVQNLCQGLYIFKCVTNNKSWIIKAIKQAY